MEQYSAPKKMKLVGDLFAVYRSRLKAPQASVEKECVRVVQEVTGFTLTTGQVAYTPATRTISLRVPSVLKTELRFHEKEIMEVLKSRLGTDGCPKVVL